MATHKGQDGVVKVGSNAVAEVRSFSIEQTADTVEDTVMTDTSRTYITTLNSFSGSLDVFWDETDTNGQVALGIGNSVTIKFMPEGDQSGDTFYEGTALVTGFTRNASLDGMVEATITVQGSGALTTSTV